MPEPDSFARDAASGMYLFFVERSQIHQFMHSERENKKEVKLDELKLNKTRK